MNRDKIREEENTAGELAQQGHHSLQLIAQVLHSRSRHLNFCNTHMFYHGWTLLCVQLQPAGLRGQVLERICYLEEKHSLSERCSSAGEAPSVELNKQCKPLSSVLEEVPSRGTLMERVEMLESRVLQLCLDEEEIRRKTPRVLTEETEGKGAPSLRIQNGDSCQGHPGKQDLIMVQGSREERRMDLFQIHKKSRRRRWPGWMQMGCSLA
ncbi:hypothetical protein Taro_009156, partial [Colocasia esculenta]|nr:hypothetical protein [Colocasia esculenta]